MEPQQIVVLAKAGTHTALPSVMLRRMDSRFHGKDTQFVRSQPLFQDSIGDIQPHDRGRMSDHG